MVIKYDITKEIFDHILAMTKHEDEKAGRIIVSIAFLSSASASVFSAFIRSNLTFLYAGIELISTVYTFSVLFVVLGALCIMHAVGPNLYIPSPWKTTQQNEEAENDENANEIYEPESYFFFEKIANENRDEWCQYFKDVTPADIKKRAQEDYINESHVVAVKIKKKVKYIKIAKVFFILSILLFVTFTLLGSYSYFLHDC